MVREIRLHFCAATNRWTILVRFCSVLVMLLGLCHGSHAVSGIVRDGPKAVAGATVRIQGTDRSVVTDGKGRFSLAPLAGEKTVTVSAWKQGYYCAIARNIPASSSKAVVRLIRYQTGDNQKYEWLPPEGAKGACSECHNKAIIDMSLDDAHLKAAVNPRFLTMYNGTDMDGNRSPLTEYGKGTGQWMGTKVRMRPDLSKPYYGPGFLLDFPTLKGECSTCHVPGSAIRSDSDPNRAGGADRYGVHCDFCHKVANVSIHKSTDLPSPGAPGVRSMDIRRPFTTDPKRPQLFFGTFDDDNVPEEDTNLPLLKESRYCAPCHVGVFWNTLVYNSYGEWLASPYSDPKSGVGKTCQECHMPSPVVWKGQTITNVAPGKGGIERNPVSIHSHRMTIDETLLRASLTMKASAVATNGSVTVRVAITNDKTGHHVPTDSPLRHLILIVDGKDGQGNSLILKDSPRLPDWCGKGDRRQGYYAGLAGKAYAKLLQELWTDVFPTGAYWNHTTVVSDNRIAAFATDRSSYSFAMPRAGKALITVTLLYRRAYRELMDWKKWTDPDVTIATEHLTVTRD